MGCKMGCPELKKSDWDKKKHVWKNTAFYTKGFFQVFHMPLTIGSAINKGFEELKAKKYTMDKYYTMLQEETGFLTGNVLFKLSKVPKKKDDKIQIWKSATLYSVFYHGEFKGIGQAFMRLDKFLKSKKLTASKYFTWTVDCPECWKERGGPTNVLFAKV